CPPTPQAPTSEQMRAGLREARDRGMLWRLEKDGQVGWLYGTLHVGKLGWAFPGPRVLAALLQAQTLALELDLGDPAFGQAMQSALAGWRERQAAHPLPADLLARVAALARAECLAGAGFDQLPALMQGLTLVAASGRRDGLDPGFAQEFILSGFAKAARKPVVALESAGQQLAAMAPD
ncbi:MAG: polysaccharide biosynthesis protein GumN, partial [Burkholderiales bacterium PBB5]